MAELVSIKRNVDVSPGQAAPAVFHCSQGDVGSKIILGLLNNGTAYAIPSGVTVTIEGSESNGSIFTPISATASGSDITFYLTGEMTAVAGPAICQAVLKSGSNILGTANFTLEVESSPMGADAPPVFTDAGWTWMLNKLTTEFVPALNDNIIDAINDKLDKNQGTANAGKYLKVGADGNVETADLDVTTDKTLSITDKAADAKAVGDELNDLKADLNHTISKNLIGMEAMVLYPVFIKAGTKLTISTSDGSNFPSSSTDILYLYLYDKDGNRTDYFGLANGQPTRTITTSASKADTYYLAWTRKYDVPLQVEVGDTKTDYSEYFLSAEALNKEVRSIGGHIANIGDLVGNVSIKNLLDTSQAIDGGYYDSDNVWVSNANLYASDLIPCVDGMRYINNYMQNINLYDYSGNHLGYVRNSDSDRSFVASSVNGKVCYFRVYGTQANKATDAVFIGNTYWGTSEVYPYGSEALVNIGTPTSKMLQKNVYTFGDSRTWYDGKAYAANTVIAGQICKGYQFWMRKLLQCNTINKGVSGYTSPQMYTAVHNADLTSADVVTLAGGINDFLNNIPVGTIGAVGGTFDTTTVCGATQAMIEDIISKKPSVKLMLINPFTGWINNDADEYPDTYASVKRNLAELYHLPILDLARSCGFNVLNRNAFYCDDMSKVTFRLHLNDLGNEVIGHMIASFVGNGY